MEQTLEKEIQSLPTHKHPWEVFFPEGLLPFEDETIANIHKKRALKIVNVAPSPITDLSREFLITSNVLLDMPVNCERIKDPELKKELIQIKKECRQRYFYDHPIPMDTPLENNEIIYGLKHPRECFYGPEATTGRLQRVFEFSKLKQS